MSSPEETDDACGACGKWFDVDEALFAKVTKITSARVGASIVVVEEISRRHDPKRPDDAERAGFRTAKVVLVIPVADDLAFEAPRQIE